MTNERIHFRLLVIECCGAQLCWVNPRFPSFCPECGRSCYPQVRGWAVFVDENAILRCGEVSRETRIPLEHDLAGDDQHTPQGEDAEGPVPGG